MQIREPAINQCAHEVHGHRRMRVRLKQSVRIRNACRRRKLWRIDDVAAITRQRDTAALFEICRTRLGILTGKASNTDNGQFQTMDECHTHLQEHFQAIRNCRRIAFGEALGTVTTLKQKTFAICRFSKVLLERQDFE